MHKFHTILPRAQIPYKYHYINLNLYRLRYLIINVTLHQSYKTFMIRRQISEQYSLNQYFAQPIFAPQNLIIPRNPNSIWVLFLFESKWPLISHICIYIKIQSLIKFCTLYHPKECWMIIIHVHMMKYDPSLVISTQDSGNCQVIWGCIIKFNLSFKSPVLLYLI